MEYTKEDWKKQGNKVIAFGRGIIAVCPSPANGNGVLEFEANAHLIAASPRLYEALGTIKRTAQSSGDNVDYLKNALRVIARISKEAIADMDG